MDKRMLALRYCVICDLYHNGRELLSFIRQGIETPVGIRDEACAFFLCFLLNGVFLKIVIR